MVQVQLILSYWTTPPYSFYIWFGSFSPKDGLVHCSSLTSCCEPISVSVYRAYNLFYKAILFFCVYRLCIYTWPLVAREGK
jgi:hypothetical protein